MVFPSQKDKDTLIYVFRQIGEPDQSEEKNDVPRTAKEVRTEKGDAKGEEEGYRALPLTDLDIRFAVCVISPLSHSILTPIFLYLDTVSNFFFFFFFAVHEANVPLVWSIPTG